CPRAPDPCCCPRAPSLDPARARAPPRGVAAAGRESDDCGAGRGCRRLGRARGREGGVRSLAAHGLALGVPPGWEGRIQRRAISLTQERTRAVVHLANFALPEQRDDFGGGLTPAMRSPDVFVVLFEYGPESLGAPLFASE